MALSTSTQALDEIFKKLMLNAGVTPGTDTVESIKGTKREQWAFPEGQMNPVNVTPFQDRSVEEQKALGLVLSQIYGHGAGYEQAEAMKSSAAASMANAGAANKNADANRILADVQKAAEEFARKRIIEEGDSKANKSIINNTPVIKKKVAKPGEPSYNPFDGVDTTPGQDENPFTAYLNHRPR